MRHASEHTHADYGGTPSRRIGSSRLPIKRTRSPANIKVCVPCAHRVLARRVLARDSWHPYSSLIAHWTPAGRHRTPSDAWASPSSVLGSCRDDVEAHARTTLTTAAGTVVCGLLRQGQGWGLGSGAAALKNAAELVAGYTTHWRTGYTTHWRRRTSKDFIIMSSLIWEFSVAAVVQACSGGSGVFKRFRPWWLILHRLHSSISKSSSEKTASDKRLAARSRRRAWSRRRAHSCWTAAISPDEGSHAVGAPWKVHQ